MNLGDAIGPKQSKLIGGILEDAVAKVVREQGDAVAVLKESLDALVRVGVQLTAIADQQQAASMSLADAARQLAARTMIPAPEVNVTVPVPKVEFEPEINVPAPVVNVDAPVTVTPQEKPDRGVRKRVMRDAQGLITEIIEEPI